MKTKIFFAGTFDIFTRGHQWIVNQALAMTDQVVVGITINPGKNPMFDLQQRIHMIRDSVPASVEIVTYDDEFTINYAKKIGATALIRGIRNATDFEYERMLEQYNKNIRDDIATLFVIAPAHLGNISSSGVKALIGPAGWERQVAKYVPKPVVFQLIAQHHTIYKNLIAAGATGNQQEFWHQVLAPYFDDERKYHTWEHITAMLSEFYRIKHLCQDPLAVEAAIWCHDIVYETIARPCENEIESAAYAKRLLQNMGMPEPFAEKVSQMILATTHREPPTDPDTQVLVDLDLAILGAEPTIFNEYEKNIRCEYQWLDLATYQTKRKKLLHYFNRRRPLYSTEYFRNRYETIAHQNLERSISLLSNPS